MPSSRTARTIASAADPALIPLGSHEGKPPFLLTRPVFVIGSRSNARINLVSSTVSKAHALLVRSNGGVYVRDLASRTKVIVNGKTLREADLRTGDELQIGRFTFRFRGTPDVPQKKVETPAARLRVAGQDLPVPIDQRVLLIGRRIVCDVHLLEETVSTAHAVIFEVDGERFIRDLGSRTGTYVNGVSTHQHQLSPGDKIRIGETDLTYEFGTAIGAADEPAVAEAPTEVPLDLLAELSPLEVAKPPAVDLLDELEMVPPASEPEVLDLPIAAATPAPISLEPLPLEPAAIELAIEPEVLDLPMTADEVEPVIETPVRPPVSVPDVIPLESEKPDESTFKVVEPDFDILPPAELSEVSVGESLEPTPAEPVVEIDFERPLNLAPPLEEVLPPLETVEVPEAAAESAVAETPIEPAIEPPLPPREDAIAAVVAEQPTSKKGRGKKQAVDQPEIIAAEAVEETPKGKAGKGKKPLTPKKGRGKPTPPPAIVEAPVETAAEIIDPLPVAEPPLLQPADNTLLGNIEPEATESVLLEPREETDFERSEPSARGPIVEPVIAESAIQTPVSPEPTLAAELEALPIESIAKDQVDPIVEPDAKAPTAVVGHLSADTLEPIELAESTPASDAAAAQPLEASEIAKLDLTSDASGIITDELSADDAKPLDLAPPAGGMDLDAELEALLAETDDTPPDTAAVTPISGDDLALEALLAEKEDRPAAEVDRTIDSATESQTEAPDAEISAELAVSPTDLAPDPLAEQTPDTLTSKKDVVAVESNFHGTQAEALADKIAGGSKRSTPTTASDTAEPDMSQSQASKLLERVKWTANHDNVLGGQPLILPESKPSALSETPLVDETPQGEISSPDSVGHEPQPYLNGHSNGHALSSNRPANQPLSLSSFEGLANSPLREMDVFSHMSPPAEEELIDAEVVTADNGEPIEAELPSSELRPRGTISGVFGEAIEPPAHRQRVRPELNGSLTAQVQPVRGDITAAEARRIRKKYLRRVSTLVGLMVVLIGGSAITIYNIIGVNGSVDAGLRFKNLNSLKQADRNTFIADQLSKLKLDTTRRQARRMLNERNPEIASGFLDDQIEYVKNIDGSGFSSNDPEIMLIRVQGKDPTADAARAMAMANALYLTDGTMLDEARKRQSTVDELNRSINDTQNQLQSISDQINRLRLTGESGPSLAHRQELDAQLTKAEANWKSAITAVTTADAILTQMKAAAPGTPIDAPTIAPNIANDTQMAQLQQQLADSQAKIKANRDAAAKAAVDARKNLDETLNGFQKQVADAQGMAGNNPELAAYITSAQRLQETIKQLTDDLIHRQEQQLGKLIELKDQANEKMELRRQEMLQSDNQLKDLNEQQAIVTRQLNTALGTGLRKEAEDLKAKLDLIKNMVKARQDLLPGDAFYADTIQRLQNLIDVTRKNIADDRSRTEQQLTSLQASFTSSQVVERLPEEQKALATSLSQQLNDINKARKEYGKTLDAGVADTDDALKSQTATLQAQLEARQKQLADANVEAMHARQEQDRLTAIDAKQSELTQLKAEEAGLQKAFFAKQREVREAKANADTATENSSKLDELIRNQAALKTELQTKLDQVPLKQSQATGMVEPQKPSESDLVIRRGEDKRLLYTLISGGAILLLFSSLILWTLHTAHLIAPQGGLAATDLQAVAAPPDADESAAPIEPTSNTPAEPEPAGV